MKYILIIFGLILISCDSSHRGLFKFVGPEGTPLNIICNYHDTTTGYLLFNCSNGKKYNDVHNVEMKRLD